MDSVVEIEEFLRGRSVELVAIRPGECVICYAARMITEFGCDTTCRWAVRYRNQLAPRATALLNRLGRRGAFCDCEIFMNGYTLISRLKVPEPLFPGLNAEELAAYGYDDPADAYELVSPRVPPPCAGVRRGSVQPCSNWRIRGPYDD